MRRYDKPVADLSQAAGPDNPPCPACGKPLFGWALLRPDETAVRRCEVCGMAVAGGPATREEALAALERARAERLNLPNRASAQAWLGASGWAGLNRESRLLFTPDAIERLGVATEKPGPEFVNMWQTMVNAFTFGHNVAFDAIGRGPATPGNAFWQRAIDWLIVVFTLVPLVLLALLVESLATLAGGGGRLRLKG